MDPFILDHRFKVLKQIKTGGFGVVYYGWDTDLDRPVAIKEIHPSLFSNAKFVDMFQDEAINTAKLNHPNIVHIYALRKAQDGRFFIVMEYIEGVDLRSFLINCGKRGSKLPEHLSAYIMKEVARALHYAHTRVDRKNKKPLAMVHRDISPANIMITVEGEIKLIDFGIAKARTRRSEKTRVGELKGKISYMSPEQALGKEDIDFHTDIFSMGVVLFELLSSHKLFDNDSEVGLLRDVSRARIPVKRFDDGISIPEIRAIVRKAVMKKPEDRFESAEAMSRALDDYLRSRSSHSYQDELRRFIQEIFFPDEINTVQRMKDQTEEPAPDTGDEEIRTSRVNLEPADRAGMDSEDVERESSPSSPQEPVHLGSPAILDVAASESSEEEPKTIIDVIRLGARTHTRELKLAGIGLVAAFMLFLLGDTFIFRSTGIGRGLYDRIHPPTVYLNTIPPGAVIHFNQEEYRGQDIRIPKVKPGNYLIRAELAGYDDVTQTLSVRSRGITIGDETVQQRYTLVFSAPVSVVSDPPGASVQFNGRVLTEKTPCRIQWKMDEALDVRLELAGFEPLGGCEINFLEERAQIEDHRWWRFEVESSSGKVYQVKGTFWKNVEFSSNPSGADVYLDNQTRSSFRTGGDSVIPLSFGRHTITYQKKGYVDQTFSVDVVASLNEEITKPLYRMVAIEAVDSESPDRSVPGAVLNALLLNGQRQSYGPVPIPATLKLGPWIYTAQLSAEGYRQGEIRIKPDQWRVQCALEQELPQAVFIIKEKSGAQRPVPGATVFLEPLESTGEAGETLKQHWGRADEQGVYERRIEAGRYSALIQADGFRRSVKEIQVMPGQDNTVHIRLEAE